MAVPETPEQMERRLLRVIAQAQFDVLANDYLWQPLPRVSPLRATPLLVYAMAMSGINSLRPLPRLRRSGIASLAFISRQARTLRGSSHGWPDI